MDEDYKREFEASIEETQARAEKAIKRNSKFKRF